MLRTGAEALKEWNRRNLNQIGSSDRNTFLRGKDILAVEAALQSEDLTLTNLDVLIVSEESLTQANETLPARELFQGSYRSVEKTRRAIESLGYEVRVLLLTSKGMVWDYEKLDPYTPKESSAHDPVYGKGSGRGVSKVIADLRPRTLVLLLSKFAFVLVEGPLMRILAALNEPPNVLAVTGKQEGHRLQKLAKKGIGVRTFRRRGVARITREARDSPLSSL